MNGLLQISHSSLQTTTHHTPSSTNKLTVIESNSTIKYTYIYESTKNSSINTTTTWTTQVHYPLFGTQNHTHACIYVQIYQRHGNSLGATSTNPIYFFKNKKKSILNLKQPTKSQVQNFKSSTKEQNPYEKNAQNHWAQVLPWRVHGRCEWRRKPSWLLLQAAASFNSRSTWKIEIGVVFNRPNWIDAWWEYGQLIRLDCSWGRWATSSNW